MASLKEVKRLKELCEKYELEGRGVLDGFPNTKLASMYNGIGPEKFPGWLRAVLDFIHPSLAPVAFIHDVEWTLSDGTKESFTASNKRFKRNGSKVAKAEYAWYNPRRYAVMNSARRFGNICQTFGWAAWRMCQSRSDLGSGEAVSAKRKFERSENHAPFTAKDVEEQKYPPANGRPVGAAMGGANAPRVAARFAAGLRPGGYSVMLSAMKNGGGAEAVQ